MNPAARERARWCVPASDSVAFFSCTRFASRLLFFPAAFLLHPLSASRLEFSRPSGDRSAPPRHRRCGRICRRPALSFFELFAASFDVRLFPRESQF